jgi:hypothetical protein
VASIREARVRAERLAIETDSATPKPGRIRELPDIAEQSIDATVLRLEANRLEGQSKNT